MESFLSKDNIKVSDKLVAIADYANEFKKGQTLLVRRVNTSDIVVTYGPCNSRESTIWFEGFGKRFPPLNKVATRKIPTQEAPAVKLSGGPNAYYDFPEGASTLQDLIEFRNMNFAQGNIFKAVYRLGNKPTNSLIYDLEKIIWFAQRELDRVKKEAQE